MKDNPKKLELIEEWRQVLMAAGDAKANAEVAPKALVEMILQKQAAKSYEAGIRECLAALPISDECPTHHSELGEGCLKCMYETGQNNYRDDAITNFQALKTVQCK